MSIYASAATARPAGPTRCFGRERELARLNDLARNAVSERCARVVAVTGPAGIGKSHLVSELARRQGATGMTTYEGHARAGDPPHACVAELADAVLLGLRAEGGPFAILDEGLEVSASLRMHPPDPDGESPPPSGRLALFERARAFLAGAGRAHPGGVIFVLHDLHHADEMTRALVEYLVRTLASPPELSDGSFPGLLVLTGRELEPTLTDHARFELAPLDADALRAYLSSPLVVERLLTASGGVPGRIETLVGLCPSLAELVHAAVAALPPQVAWLARALALLGRPANVELLARLVLDDADVVEALAASALVARRVTPQGHELAYAREADREAVVASLDEEEQRGLHLALGHALAVDGIREEDQAAEHLLLGGAAEEGTQRALSAASRLQAHFAYERALSLLRLVGKYAPREQASRAARAVQRMTARTAELAGDYATALDAVDAQLAGVPDTEPDRAALLTAKGRLHLLRGELVHARDALTEGHRLAGLDEDHELAAEANAALAEVQLLSANHDEAMRRALDALDITGVGPRAVAARLAARNILGRVYLDRATYSEAAREFSSAAIEARSHSLPHEGARALLNLGIATLRAGRYAAAEEHYRDALELAEEAVDLRQRAFCMQNLGVLAQWRRDWRAAFEHYHQAMRAFQKLGHRPWLAWVVIDLGDLYLDLGDVPRAMLMGDAAARLLETGAPSTAAVILTHFRGRVAMQRGDLEEADFLLSRAEQLADEADARDERDLAWIYRAQLLCARGMPGRALELLERLTSARAPRLAAQRDGGRASALMLAGEPADALAVALSAEEQWLELGDDEGRLAALLVQCVALAALGDEGGSRAARRRALDLDSSLRGRVPPEHAGTYGRDPLRQRILAGEPGVGQSGG